MIVVKICVKFLPRPRSGSGMASLVQNETPRLIGARLGIFNVNSKRAETTISWPRLVMEESARAAPDWIKTPRGPQQNFGSSTRAEIFMWLRFDLNILNLGLK